MKDKFILNYFANRQAVKLFDKYIIQKIKTAKSPVPLIKGMFIFIILNVLFIRLDQLAVEYELAGDYYYTNTLLFFMSIGIVLLCLFMVAHYIYEKNTKHYNNLISERNEKADGVDKMRDREKKLSDLV